MMFDVDYFFALNFSPDLSHASMQYFKKEIKFVVSFFSAYFKGITENKQKQKC